MHLQRQTTESLVSQPVVYLPVRQLARATHKRSFARLPITEAGTPDRICGQARRIGYTGNDPEDFAVYRLKIRTSELPSSTRGYVTLPGWFVLDQGVFSALPTEDTGAAMQRK